jgi:FkbM family methyltransferase
MLKLYKKIKKYIKKKCPILVKIYKLYLFNKIYLNSHFRTEHERKIAENFNIYLSNISITDRKNRLKKLKEGLDAKSKKEIDNTIFRYKILLKNNFINKKNLLTLQEIVEQKEIKRIKRYNYKKYYKFDKISPEVLYGLSGLNWLPEKQKNKLKNKTLLDLGAYSGDSALSFYYNFLPKKIYAFEPEANNFKILEKNCNKLNNNIIIPIKKAISNKKTRGNMLNDATSSKIRNDKNLQEIEITTIDNFVLENKIENINLIKMDIEGEETNALLGAEKTILKYKPILAISIYHNPQDFFEIKPWLKKLVPEYRFIIKKAVPSSFVFELMLIAYIE